MAETRPLLTFSIPTWNRAPFLAELLETLLPQFTGETRAELLISDNHSTDETEDVVQDFQARGLPCRYVRNAENIGSDANFLQCFQLAAGKYVWVFGDDDLLMPNALAQLLSLLEQGEHSAEGDFDTVYLSGFGFRDVCKPSTSTLQDALGRFAEVVTDGVYFLDKVNALIGLITANIVNKDRLLSVPHPPLEPLVGTNLMQTGWLFPVLHRRCRVLYLWQRLYGYRSANSGGWGACEVFGIRLNAIAKNSFAAEPELSRALMNGVTRYWMCDMVASLRSGGENETMLRENYDKLLRPVFGHNWRYWVFVYPLAVTPLFVMKPLHRALSLSNRLSRAVQAVYRSWFRSGQLLRP